MIWTALFANPAIPEQTPPPCNLSVTATANPQVICNPGDVSTLQAIPNGQIIGVSWSPTTGLSQPNSLITQAAINGTITYEVTVQGLSGDNLLQNGDFNNGFTNFTSDYIPGTGGSFGLLSNEGQYAVANNPSATHTNFASCADHTGGGGMMVVNGASTANQDVLCQTVNVMSGTNYAVGAWVMSVVSASPAQLQISVNGQLLGGIFNAPAATCNWTQFFEVWNSGGATTAEICIVNQNTAPSGNDFALDDLFIGEICEATDQVTIQFVEFNAEFEVPEGLCPYSIPFQLNTLLVPGATPGGTWTVDGGPAILFDPGLYGPGPHQVTYTVTNGVCSAAATHTIVVDPLPVADWSSFNQICSTEDPIVLNGLLVPGATQGGTWTIDGLPNPVFDPGNLTQGSHMVTYRVGTFPCIVEVTHTINVFNPLTPPQPVCAGGSSGSVLFSWNPVPNATGYQVVVASGQTGTLSGNTYLVNNLDPGETVTIQVTATGLPPCGNAISNLVSCSAPDCPPALIELLAVDTVCLDTVMGPLSITAGASPPGGVLTWSGPGISDPNLNEFNPQAAGLGAHSVYVHYALDNCIYNDSLQIVVTQNCSGCPDLDITINAPDVYCFLPDTSGFFNVTATVAGGDGSGTGSWSGQGIISSAQGAFSPFTALPGYNVFSYNYQENGCSYTAKDSIFVSKFPVPAFLMDNQVCLGDTAIVDFLGNSSLPFNFLWDFDGGEVTSGTPPDNFGLTWTEPDSHTVILQLEQLGCVSKPFFQPIDIASPVDTPVVMCDQTLNSVEFSWNQVPNAQAYVVYVIVGPNGEVTSDTSYSVPNLLPGQTIQVELVTISTNACPGNSTLQTCMALPCSGDLINLQTPLPRCVSAGETDTIPINYVLYLDSLAPRTVTWQGPGIIDSTMALVELTPEMEGQENWVMVTVESQGCMVTDSVLVEVIPPPVASFSLPDSVCLGDTAVVSYAVQSGSNVMLNWDWGGGLPQDSTDSEYRVVWSQAGHYTPTLTAVQDGCQSDPVDGNIEIVPSMEAPEINCQPGLDQIFFNWPAVEGATGYQVNVLDGPAGQMTADTAILFSGLGEGTAVTIEVIALSGGPCPETRAELTCTTTLCPQVGLDIQPIADICYDGTPFTIPLEIAVQGDTAGGQLTWSGPGVNGNQLTINGSLVGQTPVIHAVFTRDICTFSDSISFTVNSTPVAAFTAPDSLCTGQNAVLTFTGTAGPDAVFHWTAGTQHPAGAGPHTVNFPNEGDYDLSLWVEENGCMSDTVFQPLVVLAPFAAPQINCSPGLDRLTFYWTQPDGIPATQVTYTGAGVGAMSSDTSYQITGLMPGEGGSITVTWSDPGLPCRDVTFSASCEAESCPDIVLGWQTASPLCRGEDARVTFSLSGQSGPVDLLISINGQAQWLTGVNDGRIWNTTLDAGAVISIDSVVNPSNPLCPVSIPAPLNITVSQPVFAGNPTDEPAVCTGANNVIDLAGLLDQETAGGAWTEASGVPSTGSAFNPSAATFRTTGQAPGIYVFQYLVMAQDPCPDASAQVKVRVNANPVADAGPDLSLGCLVNEVSIGSGQTTAGLQYQWTGAGGSLPLSPSAAVTEVNQADTYTLLVTDPATGCTATDMVTVTSDENIVVPFASVIPITCFQANDGFIRIDSVLGGQQPYTYSLNGGPASGQSLMGPLQPGVYDLTVRDATGCEASLQLTLQNPDQIDVKLITNLTTDENLIDLGDTIQLIALINRDEDQVGSIVWKPDSINYAPAGLTREISPGEATYYHVTVTDLNGCSDSDRLPVFVRKPRNIYIPNGFTPDGDGDNDIFYIFAGQGVRKINSFMIFDRWGDMVFQHYNFQPNDPVHGWDGTHNGLPMNAAVYVYAAEIEFIDGEKVVYKGDVALVR